MAIYKDIEALKLHIQRYLMPNVDDDGTVRVEDAERYFIGLLDKAPTADVVSRSEVEKIFDEIKNNLPIDKSFHSQDIGIGFSWALAEVRKTLAELKKRFIGEQR